MSSSSEYTTSSTTGDSDDSVSVKSSSMSVESTDTSYMDTTLVSDSIDDKEQEPSASALNLNVEILESLCGSPDGSSGSITSEEYRLCNELLDKIKTNTECNSELADEIEEIRKHNQLLGQLLMKKYENAMNDDNKQETNLRSSNYELRSPRKPEKNKDEERFSSSI